MAEIKSLDHWRRLDEVAAQVVGGYGTFEATVTITDGQVVAVEPPPLSWWDDGWEKVEPSRWRLVPPCPERAPFPARALRDRPWDISALVEE